MFKKIALSAAFAMAMIFSTAAPANAGTLCNITRICGDVRNLYSSSTGILATNQWPADSSKASWQRLAPGQACTYKDCDGFYIPSGYIAFDGSTVYRAGWHKVTDNVNAALKVKRK